MLGIGPGKVVSVLDLHISKPTLSWLVKDDSVWDKTVQFQMWETWATPGGWEDMGKALNLMFC